MANREKNIETLLRHLEVDLEYATTEAELRRLVAEAQYLVAQAEQAREETPAMSEVWHRIQSMALLRLKNGELA